MNPKKKTPPVVRILVFTMLTTFLWVGLEVYRAFTVKPPPVVSDEILAPVSPNLDAEVLDKLQQRVYIADEEIGDIKIDSAEVPVATALPTPEATDSAVTTDEPTQETEQAEEEGETITE